MAAVEHQRESVRYALQLRRRPLLWLMLAALGAVPLVNLVAVGLAVALIALASIAAGALEQAASGLVDWHRAKNAYPLLFYAGGSGNETRVHVCINTTEVWIIKNNAMVRAGGRYLALDGHKWKDFPNMPHGRRWRTEVAYCQGYLGEYKVGDAVTYMVKIGSSSYLHNYTVRIAQQR